ncbi:hypothetical protein K439DRAFT_1624972 [Ramaria rubella]|nr:hypothetical protein K439DRAFT_1624972 [Ramaria rubella]
MGKDKYPARKTPTRATLLKHLLDPGMGMKTDLLVLSDALQLAARLMGEKQAHTPSKSQARSTRTLAAQTDTLVAKVQVEGTVKPIKLAQTLSELNISKLTDPQVVTPGEVQVKGRNPDAHAAALKVTEESNELRSNLASPEEVACGIEGRTPKDVDEWQEDRNVAVEPADIEMGDAPSNEQEGQGEDIAQDGMNTGENNMTAMLEAEAGPVHNISANNGEEDKATKDHTSKAQESGTHYDGDVGTDVVFLEHEEYPVAGLGLEALVCGSEFNTRGLIDPHS